MWLPESIAASCLKIRQRAGRGSGRMALRAGVNIHVEARAENVNQNGGVFT
jgi:hypothetical protein